MHPDVADAQRLLLKGLVYAGISFAPLDDQLADSSKVIDSQHTLTISSGRFVES